MNLKQLATSISVLEGGKVNQSIAEIAEVLACAGIVLRRLSSDEALVTLAALLTRAGKRSNRART